MTIRYTPLFLFVLLCIGLASCTTRPYVTFQKTPVTRYYSPQPQVLAQLPAADSAVVAHSDLAAPAVPAADLFASATESIPVPSTPAPISSVDHSARPKPAPANQRQSVEVAVRQPTIKAPPTSQPTAYAAPRAGEVTNGLAVASLVCGILGLLLLPVLLGPLAIIFGAVAMSQIRRRGDRGRGMAVAGLVMGIVATVFVLIVLAR